MKIKNVTIDGFAALAPMAGVADRAVRQISRSCGAAFTVGEMTSTKGVAMNSEKSLELLRVDTEGPFAVQLFGADAQSMAEAAKIAAALAPDIIDINMGCPAPKVTKNGAGSALLKTLDLAGDIVAAAVANAGEIPVTVKIRRGFDAGEDICVAAALTAQAAGAAAVTVHGRTRAQMYAPPVDLGCIARVKAALSIPVIGNGDIFTAEDAKHMYAVTGCDLVMVGRGALGNPWLFDDINRLMRGENPMGKPPLADRLAMMRRELELLIADKGEGVGFREARKHAGWYMGGLRGATVLRTLCGQINGWQEIDNIIAVAQQHNTDEPEI